MLFSSSKCPLPALVAWCRALKHSIGAGLDPIKIFKQQGRSGPRALRWLAIEIAEKLSKGESLEDALEPHRNRFPPLFVELVAVGEQSGRLEDTFHELSEYYDTTLRVQRDFRSQMAYPAIQFVAAVLIISGLIFILDMLGSKMDPLGFGLTGAGGAFLFMFICFGFVGGLLFLFKLSADNVQWRARMEAVLLWLPAWGPALLNFALHRFCVALRMTTEAALRTEKVLHYSFRATANGAFLRGEDRAVAAAKKGAEIHEALAASGAPFPEEFQHMIVVGEESGEMSELMEKLSKNYLDEGKRRLKEAAQYTAWALYGLVAMLIIFCIFSIATKAYINPINEATKGM
jgi:type IV pilus assembly protein PilC